MKKAILLPDLHHPYHNKRAWKAVLSFIKWFRPNTIVLMGDALEMRAIDHWKKEKGNHRAFEGIRLLHDYNDFIKDVLEPLETLRPKARKIYLGGNHEQWAYNVIDQNPELEGMIEPENAMKLEERGWEWIPFINRQGKRGMLKLGKLTLVHGEYTNKFHASKTADTYLKSVCYAHCHDVQVFTKVHVEDPNDYHTCQSIGCLCDKSPAFLWGRPNRWVHAFGALYLQPNGMFNLYVPIIIKGRFVYANKLFDWTQAF